MITAKCHSTATGNVLPKNLYHCNSKAEVADEFNWTDDMEEGSTQEIPMIPYKKPTMEEVVESNNKKSVKNARDARAARRSGKGGKFQHNSMRHHSMLPVFVTISILIAHLFTFRQFSFALIDV
jgi:hypothetical protein